MRAPLLLLLAACSGDPAKNETGTLGDTDTADTGESLDPGTVPLAGACPLATDFGGFLVTASETATEVDGRVTDGVIPFTVLEEIEREGDCAILRRNTPFCDPGCTPDKVCDFDGECIPYPVSQDLGTVSIEGMVQPVVMEPVFPGYLYYDTSLPHPGFAAGELLTLSMPEGAYGPAELHGVGVEPLDLVGAAWTVEAGVDLTITWPAPTTSIVRSEIAVQISIDQHGVSPSVLQCVFADDGEGTVAGSTLTTLVGVGVTGFPNATIERRTVDNAPAGAGCLDFTVTSPRGADIDVEGHTPCVSDDDCPDGQDCNEELQTCE